MLAGATAHAWQSSVQLSQSRRNSVVKVDALQAWGIMHAMDVPADDELASATTSMLDDAHYDSHQCSLNNGIAWG